MDGINLWARNPLAVQNSIELGEIVHINTAAEELTDEFLLFAIESRLLKKWADEFPDPRLYPEISMQVILACSLAARFAGLYSLRKTGFVLRSARVLGALGYSVEVLSPGNGLSSRGTTDDKLISGDVIRKLLVKIEQQVEPQPGDYESVADPILEAKARGRPSRREVKQSVDRLQAEYRGRKVGEQLIAWYNQSVAISLLKYSEAGKGRRIHILDTTRVEVELETDTYECSGVVRNDDGSLSRGYKLLTLRTLFDTAGLMSGVAMSAIQVHDLELAKPLLIQTKALRRGDLILMDRAFIDGATISYLKMKRKLDVIVPLRSDMLSYQEAVRLAEIENHWEKHPSRADQQIALVLGVEHVYDNCEMPLNACVIRFFNQKKKQTDYIVLVTTDLSLSATWIVRHYEERPEIEQDYEQLKSGGWLLQKLSTTRYSEIVFYILTVIVSYSLYCLFANTKGGARFADKTRQVIVLEQIRTNRTHIIVYAGGYFEIFETLSFVRLVLQLPAPVQKRLYAWLDKHLNHIEKRE